MNPRPSSDDTEHLLRRTPTATSYGATTDDGMSFLAHDHAYEHPHHGVGLRDGEGRGGVQVPIPALNRTS
jgi:hypothetical protein